MGFAYDVLTDEDLHMEGQALLSDYRCVITGSHPEYWSTVMRAGFEGYMAHGGRGMYLGGNGWYWITSFHLEAPWIIEVRRGQAGSRCWSCSRVKTTTRPRVSSAVCGATGASHPTLLPESGSRRRGPA